MAKIPIKFIIFFVRFFIDSFMVILHIKDRLYFGSGHPGSALDFGPLTSGFGLKSK